MTFELFDEKNELLIEYYARENIKIVDNNNHSNQCIIFFSSNGIYFPNDTETFLNRIQLENRYEWSNVTRKSSRIKKYGKIIYVRDIYKQWYVKGVSKEINSIDKLIEYLREQTIGFEVTTVGNSAGGYIATLIGLKLDVKRVFNFSGQYNLNDIVDSQYYLNKERKSNMHYYNLVPLLIEKSVDVFYFYPAYSKNDMEQAELVEGVEAVYSFAIDSDDHGLTVLPMCYQYMFTMNNSKMAKLYKKTKNKIINRKLFLIQTAGIYHALVDYTIFKLGKSVFNKANL